MAAPGDPFFDDDPALGPAGLPFPGEHEWLDLPMPPAAELEVRADFVARTLAALGAAAPGPDAAAVSPDPMLPPHVLRAFRPPPPSPDFVSRTLVALQHDRRTNWQETLARYVAPEPSPRFVARTLAALADDQRRGDREPPAGDAGRGGWRSKLPWLWPVLAAAGVATWLALARADRAPLELRLARHEPAAFAHAYAETPLPAVLAAVSHAADPDSLPTGGADGAWLLLGGSR